MISYTTAGFTETIRNPELQLAHEFVEATDCNIFLTGKAGTGKTTFLQGLKDKTPKRMIITAPTGVAAINAGGVTLHSFFQMPFGPFVPGSEAYGRQNRHRFSKEKVNIIKSLDLLIIDEISMVRADLLDGIDAVLRRYRRSDRPFGGVQLLMIGDLHQLPPVVKEAEQEILRQLYESPYFFSSNALGQTELVTIELQHIYRQSDARFIHLLNRVRDNRLDDAVLQELNSRYRPNFVPADEEGYITLSTHNRGAEAINEAKLQALPQREHRFKAAIDGDFPDYAFPTLPVLKLKKGAQVMFVRNDGSPDKLFFNGKIGKITRLSDDAIRVRCPGDDREIEVERVSWENIKYQLDPETKEITVQKVGEFEQFPLKLAWAVTIHKSQGLTFDRAVIDAWAAFAHGQVYVALSRCRSFEGMVLSSPISPQAVKTDSAVSDFVGQSGRASSPDKLASAKIAYQQRLLRECFDFQRLRGSLGRLVRVLLANARSVKVSGVGDLRELEQQAVRELVVISGNFRRQLEGLFAADCPPAEDDAVRERLAKASAYFQEKIDTILASCLPGLHIDTDNREIAKQARNALDDLRKETAIKLAAVRACENGFSPPRYLRAISETDLDLKPAKPTKPAREQKAAPVEYTASDIGHPEMFQLLKEWRAGKAAEAGVPDYRILHQNLLIQIAVNLPDNRTALRAIKGIGKRLVEKHGDEVLALVVAYRREHEIEKVVLPVPREPPERAGDGRTSKPPIGDTRQASLALIEQGLTIEQAAEERGLVRSTIEGHLATFIEAGKLDIDRLLPGEKRTAIEQKLAEMQGRPLGEIKSALGEEYSYGEIKMVLAHQASRAPRSG